MKYSILQSYISDSWINYSEVALMILNANILGLFQKIDIHINYLFISPSRHAYTAT